MPKQSHAPDCGEPSDLSREALQSLASALGRQAARQLWADALRGDAAVASAEIAEPKQACVKSGPRRAAR